MDATLVLGIIKEVIPVAKLAVREASKLHGIVYKREPAEVNGIRGCLVWDYILLNEITFDDVDGNIISFFTSISDKETAVRWDQLVSEYGIKE